MYLARIVGPRQQLYRLVGSHEPRAWTFWCYERGASAIDRTPLQAVVAARRVLARQAMVRVYQLKT